MPLTEPKDPIAALSPEHRLAVSAALTEVFIGEIDALAAEGRRRMAEAQSQSEPEQDATVAA